MMLCPQILSPILLTAYLWLQHTVNDVPPARALPKVEDGAWSPLSLEEQSARSLYLYTKGCMHVTVYCGHRLVWSCNTGSNKTLGTILCDPIVPSSAGQVDFRHQLV